MVIIFISKIIPLTTRNSFDWVLIFVEGQHKYSRIQTLNIYLLVFMYNTWLFLFGRVNNQFTDSFFWQLKDSHFVTLIFKLVYLWAVILLHCLSWTWNWTRKLWGFIFYFLDKIHWKGVLIACNACNSDLFLLLPGHHSIVIECKLLNILAKYLFK